MNHFFAIFTSLLEATVAASVVILIILVIQGVFRRKLGARIRSLLWALVIIRLLIPVFPESTMSIFQVMNFSHLFQEKLWSSGEQEVQNGTAPLQESRRASTNLNAINEPAPFLLTGQQTTGMQDTTMTKATAKATAKATNATNATNANMYSPVLQIAACMWLAGVVVLLINLLLFMYRMANLRKQLYLVSDPGVLAILDKGRKRFNITRNIPLYTGSSNSSPYLSGLLRPWIFIPQAAIREMDPTQLYHILAHELAHYKRKDMVWSLLASLAAAIHWVNPLIWLVMRRIKADRELACDAYVLEKEGEGEAVAYGMTMISFLQRYSVSEERRGLLYFYNSGGRKEVFRRITNIKSFKSGSYRISVIAILLMTMLGAATLTNAAENPLQAIGSNQPFKANEEIVKPTGLRIYNSLDRAVNRVDFAFEVPSVLPPDSQFREVSLMGTVPINGPERIDKVSISFGPGGSKPSDYGFFSLEATNQRYTNDHKELIQSLKEQLQKPSNSYKSTLEERDYVVAGMNVHELHQRIEFEKFSSASSHLFWQRNGISYTLNLYGTLSAQKKDALAQLVISSMKLPDEKMRKFYVNKDALTVDVIDREDLQMATAAIGFAPKLPSTVSDFSLRKAFVSSKINFSYARTKEEESTRVLLTEYDKPDPSDKQLRHWFRLYQIKDDGQFVVFKAKKEVQIYGGDRGQLKLPAELITIGGKEVLRTTPYKSDVGLGTTTQAPMWITYFWVDNGVFYRTAFRVGEIKDPEAVIATLIKTQAVELEG